jgi:two-component system copper resistance phosphate regulon response regulator CusR
LHSSIIPATLTSEVLYGCWFSDHSSSESNPVFQQREKMKILIVDDEPRAAEYLSQGLTEHGYVVETALNGIDGLHVAVEGEHDLILLDVMLPGVDGFALLSALRTVKQTPVLMLTARGNTNDKVKGFDLGADDYLVKPFQFPELLARIRTLLKRGSPMPADHVLRSGDLEVDPIKHRAVRAGKPVDLSAKELALLIFMMRRSGEVLSRTQIASHVWDINFDSDTNIIDVAIKRLRAKIDEPYAEKLIHTVRGVGYVFGLRS